MKESISELRMSHDIKQLRLQISRINEKLDKLLEYPGRKWNDEHEKHEKSKRLELLDNVCSGGCGYSDGAVY
jgi:hypothetical protein